jgi:hypothetical protein
MTRFDVLLHDNTEEYIELITKDDTIIKINNLLFLSKYPESTLWMIYNEDGLEHLKNFIKNNITKLVFKAILYFYSHDKWPYNIKIPNVMNPYAFLNLPKQFEESEESDDDDEYENSSDGM